MLYDFVVSSQCEIAKLHCKYVKEMNTGQSYMFLMLCIVASTQIHPIISVPPMKLESFGRVDGGSARGARTDERTRELASRRTHQRTRRADPSAAAARWRRGTEACGG